MYVYLKFGDVVKVVSNVTIDENYCPVVDGKLILESPRDGESAMSKSTIDAIAWFKSLPMEAVYIDCGARDARWSPKLVTMEECPSGEISPRVSVLLRKPPSNPATKEKEQDATLPVPFMPESARPLFSECPGVLDFNPIIDEMFERTEELLCRWDVLSQNGETNKEIAKILHCYVFPVVSFKHADIPVLQECLQIIVLKQKAIEKDIVNTEKSIAVTENVLNQQKQILLANESMTTQSYLQACEADFVEMFYFHVTKDLQNKNMKLDVLQQKVNELKRSGQDAEKLRKYKKERDDLHETIQKLLTMREAICNHLYRPFIPRKKKKKKQKKVKISENETRVHTKFKEVHQCLVKDKDLLKRLCYRKLHSASLREAIESTVNMLKQNSPGTLSLGDFSEFSVYLGTKREDKEQWESMQARVEGWMSSLSDMCHFHMKGCQFVKDLSAGMLSDSRIAFIGLDPSETELQEIGEGGRQSAGDAEDPEGQNVCINRAPMVRVIKNQVLVHTWDMAEKIANQLDFDASPVWRHINRAWVCYDPHFWKEAGKAVENVYTHYHAPQARRVYCHISSVALADIMDSNFIQEFFVHGASIDHHSAKDSSSESACARLQSSDTASVVSLDLQRFSMTDLYALVNQDGARLACQMLGFQSATHSVNSLGSYSSSDSNDLGKVSLSKEGASADVPQVSQLQRENGSASDSGTSVHSDDLFDTDGSISDKSPQERETTQSRRAVASVLSCFFDSIVEPYQAKVQEVLDAPSIMEKMQAVWQSVDFLSKKTGEVCKARGMDTLLPMSIFATASFSEEMFVKYYIQLLILTDLKPSFALHSMYDFSLTSAFSAFMYLFEDMFPGRVQSDGSLSSV